VILQIPLIRFLGAWAVVWILWISIMMSLCSRTTDSDEVMGKMRACREAGFCMMLVWQKVKCANPNTIANANPNTSPIPNTNPNLTLSLTLNRTNPKLQARVPAFYHLPSDERPRARGTALMFCAAAAYAISCVARPCFVSRSAFYSQPYLGCWTRPGWAVLNEQSYMNSKYAYDKLSPF